MNHLDSELVGEAGEVMEDFRFHELLERPVLQPLLVIIVMMALLQFSGQGAVTAYTAQIFKVNMKGNPSGRQPNKCFPLMLAVVSCNEPFYNWLQDAGSSLEPTDCALLVGVTYLASALLSLVLKNLVGRRLLLLTSQLGMAVSHLGLGLYFHQLPDTEEEMEESSRTWLPLPLVLAFTVSYNLGLGSLTWVVATEVLPIRYQNLT